MGYYGHNLDSGATPVLLSNLSYSIRYQQPN